jgi:hypothetical protein
VKLLRECDGGETKAWKYSFEIKTLHEAMGQESSYATRSASGPVLGAPPKLAASTGALAQTKKEECKTDQYVQGNKTQPMTLHDATFKTVNQFRQKMELPNHNLQSILKKPTTLKAPLSHVENQKEQSQSETRTVTVAEVYEPPTSKTNHKTPRMPDSGAIRINMKKSPPPCSTVVLEEDIISESTDF